MRARNRPAEGGRLGQSAAERLGAIVEAAERAAEAVIDDAERQARHHLAEAQAEADRLASERLASLTELTDSLTEEAEAIRNHSERLLAALDEVRREIGANEGEPRPGGRVAHLSAVEAPPQPRPPVADQRDADSEHPKSLAGARLLATQMAVSGSSREEIEARLRNGFEIEDTAAILDAILGPEG